MAMMFLRTRVRVSAHHAQLMKGVNPIEIHFGPLEAHDELIQGTHEPPSVRLQDTHDHGISPFGCFIIIGIIRMV
jgi:hypothetical protein